jgi:hypothetical protein
VALTVHLKRNGVPLCLILDVVKVAESHSGLNLATTFVKILEEFGIIDKVSIRVFHMNKAHQRIDTKCYMQ